MEENLKMSEKISIFVHFVQSLSKNKFWDIRENQVIMIQKNSFN